VAEKLLSIRSGCRSKAIVDAELHGGDGLFEVDARHHFGNAKDGPGEAHVACAEVVEIVLDFCGPILPESPFDATADGPACAGLAGQDVFVECWYVRRILNVPPHAFAICRSDLYQRGLPRPLLTFGHGNAINIAALFEMRKADQVEDNHP
jgi:hypothetical protein